MTGLSGDATLRLHLFSQMPAGLSRTLKTEPIRVRPPGRFVCAQNGGRTMSYNHVGITGNITRDPELRTTQSGWSVLSFTLAVNDRKKNASTGQWEDYTNFIPCFISGNERPLALAPLSDKGNEGDRRREASLQPMGEGREGAQQDRGCGAGGRAAPAKRCRLGTCRERFVCSRRLRHRQRPLLRRRRRLLGTGAEALIAKLRI